MKIGIIDSSKLTTKDLSAAAYLWPARSVEFKLAAAERRLARAEDEVARLRQKRDEILKEGLK